MQSPVSSDANPQTSGCRRLRLRLESTPLSLSIYSPYHHLPLPDFPLPLHTIIFFPSLSSQPSPSPNHRHTPPYPVPEPRSQKTSQPFRVEVRETRADDLTKPRADKPRVSSLIPQSSYLAPDLKPWTRTSRLKQTTSLEPRASNRRSLDGLMDQ
ncbi:hypothetical protein K491DRAFT_413124 [Lophiostoma macrostomum CBS 122681]|uniref:Uncharacterized protein n=1 Tax=Lophiostoma macrostomum CBS 122681 TaxID=1314788 RepID=A0A6A6T8S2_9PLEO|nr:hypothetical protein K491DRAFT_413124 [Lophiostoma macrostomum CBS 122681]